MLWECRAEGTGVLHLGYITRISTNAKYPFVLLFLPYTSDAMDTAIDLSDPSKALDLANIRFQLM